MGKATGFLEYDRQALSCRAPEERIRDFAEFRLPMEADARRVQAARCMNCGVPFCQSGVPFGGAVSGCPLHNLIPEWNDELYSGDMREALSRLLKTNNFPEFTGRVCPALCEAACTCGLGGSPVTVHDNERFVIENGFANGWMQPRVPTVRTEKRVAVIGSGPAGLAAADMLNRRGHCVTVYERDRRPGGLLMYGIPNMKLDKAVIARRTRLMEAEGVTFVTGTDVGRDVTLETLSGQYDAIVLCCGAKLPRDLAVPGRDADGVFFAVDYLRGVTEKVIGETQDFTVTAAGKNVVIVGGGDTGNDCVATALRQGAKSVVQLEMMPQPPKTRAADNPWPEWQRTEKTGYGQEEAIAVFGRDPRIYQRTVKSLEKDMNGALVSVITIALRPETDAKTGRTTMKPVEGSEETLPCELLLIAAGFVGCEDYVADAFGVPKTACGCLTTADGGFATASPGIFAAGDCRRGQSLVVHAIAEGRACAKEVDEYLMGYSNMYV